MSTEQEITGVGMTNPKGDICLCLWEQERRGKMTGVRVDGDLITVEGDFPVARRYPHQVVLACSKSQTALVGFLDEDQHFLEIIELPVTVVMPA